MSSSSTRNPTPQGTTTDKADDPLTTSISAGHSPSATTADGPSADTGSSETCCQAHPAAGCDDARVQACVCAIDAVCCLEGWDSACVGIALARCDATCDEPTTSTGAADTGGETPAPVVGNEACCDLHDAPGCNEPSVQTCVCDDDPYCCDTRWDDQCVAKAVECGATCTSCCKPGNSPSCGDPEITACVCAIDDWCCTMAWDEQCVATATTSCGGDCSDLGCCSVHDDPSCDDAAVESCVCDLDAFCCTAQWDDICVGHAQESCNAVCR